MYLILDNKIGQENLRFILELVDKKDMVPLK